MYDYNYGYDYVNPGINTPGMEEAVDLAGNILEGFVIFSTIMLLISLAVTILLIISNWKIFQKAKRNGWESLVPVHNMFVLLEIAGTPTWHIFLFFVPFANIYAIFRMFIDLAHKFGKSTGFGVATAFFSIICLPILGFSKKIQYDFGDSVEPEKNENNIESQQMNYEPKQEQSFNMEMPIYNQGMNSNEDLSQKQTSEIMSQPENSIQMPEQVYAQQMNEITMNYETNGINQQITESINMEVPVYNENINNIETVMPIQPVQPPMYTEPMNTMENVMPTQNEEIIVPIQVQNTPQEPVYQEQMQTQPMEFNQQVEEPIFSQTVQQQPLPNVVQEPVMTNPMVMPEQNNNQNSTMM